MITWRYASHVIIFYQLVMPNRSFILPWISKSLSRNRFFVSRSKIKKINQNQFFEFLNYIYLVAPIALMLEKNPNFHSNLAYWAILAHFYSKNSVFVQICLLVFDINRTHLNWQWLHNWLVCSNSTSRFMNNEKTSKGHRNVIKSPYTKLENYICEPTIN